MKHIALLSVALSVGLFSCTSGSKADTDKTAEGEVSATDSVTAIATEEEEEVKITEPRVVDPLAANAEKTDFRAASKALTTAYPDFIKAIEGNEVVFTDGSRMTYDDGRTKDFDTLLDDGDVEDMFFVRYEVTDSAPEYLHDAGRSRSEALFKKMYGNSPEAVRRNLVKVAWFGSNVDFTRVNGAADSLRKVADELAGHPELKKYLASSGTFYWRPVRGAKRLSAHSYGIAFDIAVPYSDYWLWKNKGAKETDRVQWANRIPKEIVEIFQRHGFIWGGGWYHFDTMHFEFRPEILQYSQHYGQ